MKAWELLSKPGAWTQKVCARDEFGTRVGATSDSACSWCIIGAILRLYPYEVGDLREKLYGVLPKGFSIAQWNDTPERTQEEVVAVLKELDI